MRDGKKGRMNEWIKQIIHPFPNILSLSKESPATSKNFPTMDGGSVITQQIRTVIFC